MLAHPAVERLRVAVAYANSASSTELSEQRSSRKPSAWVGPAIRVARTRRCVSSAGRDRPDFPALDRVVDRGIDEEVDVL